MTQAIDSLRDIADRFDAIVLDQWGVLHDGTAPYPGAIAAVQALKAGGARLAVLSNSGKRAAPNAARIAAMGFEASMFDLVMTSGEALWQDIAQGRVAVRRFCAITRDLGDAEDWAKGLEIAFTDGPGDADAILLMGLPDGDTVPAVELLDHARKQGLPIFCTNPDRASPRAGGVTVVSPGALAHDAAKAGMDVTFYGKPHRPVFAAVAAALGVVPERLLMVGDSLEHDIAGGHAAGWATAFVQGGLHVDAFASGADVLHTVAVLAQAERTPMPTYTLAQLG